MRHPRRTHRRVDDRGSETVSLAILFPMALILVLLIVQAGMLWHARNVLSAAAQAGADAGRVAGGTTGQAHRSAQSFLDRAAGDVITAPTVHATVGSDSVRVHVSGTVANVLPIPGLELRVDVGAVAAKERFTTPGDAR